MPSFRYRMVRTLLRLLPLKAMMSASPERLLRLARKLNQGKESGVLIPKDPSFTYEDCPVVVAGQSWHCLQIRDAKACEKPAKALLYLYGGGMISAPDTSDLRPALQLARVTKREVYVPFYPLCLENSVRVSLDMILACYKAMLQSYLAHSISVLGYSSGANLALGLSHMIREVKGALPQPEQLLLISPGAMSKDPEWIDRAKTLARKDVLVGYPYLQSAKTIMEHGEALPEWFLTPWAASFSGFPPCHFWFGGDELFAASIPNFKAACERAGIPHTMTVGEGLCHAYPFIPGPGFPEQKEALDQIATVLKSGREEQGHVG